MAKLSLPLQGRMAGRNDSTEHDGTRISGWDADDDVMVGKLTKAKKRSLLKQQADVQDQGAQFPENYVEKMHIKKANWLGRMNRQGTAR